MKDTRGSGLVFAILLILGLSVSVGLVSVSARWLFDERGITETQKRLKRIGTAISWGSSVSNETQSAAQRHYEQDVGKLPSTLTDLQQQGAASSCAISTSTQKLSGWCGPYFITEYSGDTTTFSDFWGSSLVLDTANRRLRSVGPNRTDESGAGDDLVHNF